MTVEDILAITGSRDYFVDGILAKGQNCLIGGPEKSFKSAVALDLAVSLASGQPFLGEFRVKKPVPVFMISCEDDELKHRDRLKAILQSRGIENPKEIRLRVSFEQPDLGQHLDTEEILAEVIEHGVEVVIVDTMYRCIGPKDQSGNPINFGLDSSIGRFLSELEKPFREKGISLVLLHHSGKGASSRKRDSGHSPCELSDLSGAGFSRYARQWLILSPAGRSDGKGSQKLWLKTGSSNGLNCLYVLDVSEGEQISDWRVSVQNGEAHKREKDIDRERRTQQRLENQRNSIVKAVRGFGAEGISLSRLKKEAYSGKNLKSILDSLVQTSEIETFLGKNKGTPCNLYRIPVPTETGEPDESVSRSVV